MRESWKYFYHKSLTTFTTVALCILFFFIIFRFDQLQIVWGKISDILKPFAYGAVIAYLLTPICNWLEREFAKMAALDKKPEEKAKKLEKRFGVLSIFLSLVFFGLIIYGLIAMVVPQFISSVANLIESMPGYIESTSIWFEALVADNPVMVGYVEQYFEDILANVQDFTKTNVIPNLNSIITGLTSSVWTLILGLMDFIIGIIVAVYLMNNRKIFARHAKMLVHALFPQKEGLPEGKEQKADWIIRETYILNHYLGGFVKGKLVDSLIIGLICMTFTAIADMPYALLVSVIIGVTNIIPFFGPFIGAIPMSVLILMVDPLKCVYFVIFILVLQQFDGNILGPYILGDVTKLNSFWVLFAILLFGGLFGIMGMVVGVPIFAFFYQLLREWVHKRLGDPLEKQFLDKNTKYE